jgi:hypothetical protein
MTKVMQRDKAILNDLSRFRVMRRDDIVELHFNGLKRPVTGANTVLKRLRRDGRIKAATDRHQYLYFHGESNMKKDSMKIPHFLKIVEFYREISKHETPRIFNVEPKYGDKGTVEPDTFMIWRKAPFYVEIQRSVYSAKVFSEKMDRYETFFHGDTWRHESWQPRDKQYFPNIWVIGETRYDVGQRPFRVFQSRNVEEFLTSLS